MKFRIFATAMLVLGSATSVPPTPPSPPAVGLSESAAKESAALFAALAAAKSDAEAREIEDRLGRSGEALPTRNRGNCWRSRARRNCVSTTPKRSFT